MVTTQLNYADLRKKCVDWFFEQPSQEGIYRGLRPTFEFDKNNFNKTSNIRDDPEFKQFDVAKLISPNHKDNVFFVLNAFYDSKTINEQNKKEGEWRYEGFIFSLEKNDVVYKSNHPWIKESYLEKLL